MRVLVACESSGIVRDAFASRGHDAWSCDLLECERPGNHIRGPVEAVLYDGWDLMIAHPPCTYLCSSGMHWTARGLRDPELTERALRFVAFLMCASIPRICIENPVGIIGTRIRKADQYVHPYMFGHDASKRTGLWLKGLPLLVPTDMVAPRYVCPCGRVALDMETECDSCGAPYNLQRPRWGNQTNSGQNRLGPSIDRWRERSRTYAGIAAAMAQQWG